MNADRIRRELYSLQTSILTEQKTQRKYAVPSHALTDAKRIYRSVGLHWNEIPFAVHQKVRTAASKKF